MTETSLSVCWVGGARYSKPLDTTSIKKWAALHTLNIHIYVIAFATHARLYRFTEAGAHFLLLPSLPFPLLRYALMLLLVPFILLWLTVRRGVNVIVAQSPYEGAVGALVKSIARLFGKRVALILEDHGDFEVSIFLQRRIRWTNLYRWVMRRLALYSFTHADVFRVISDFTHQQVVTWMEKTSQPPKPIVRFMAWTDSDVFANTPRAIPVSQTVDLVYIGVFIPLKGVHHLIEAFAALAVDFPESHLWLIGSPGDPAYTARLHEDIQDTGLTERVHMLSHLPQTALAEHLGRARVLVLPSLSEGLGRVVIEAMYCGTPVIGSNTGGIPDIVKPHETGYLVPPGDSQALEAALRHVLSLPVDEIEALGQRAKAFALEFFSPTVYLEGYRRLFAHAAAAL